MKLEELEAAEKVVRLCSFTSTSFIEWMHLSPVALSKAQCDVIAQLVADGQFFVLLDLKRAERYALHALGRLDHTTEYLREELEHHVLGLQELLVKIEVEEALRRDRAVLLTQPPPPDEQGESHGLLANLRTVLLSDSEHSGVVSHPAESVEEPRKARDDEGGGRSA